MYYRLYGTYTGHESELSLVSDSVHQNDRGDRSLQTFPKFRMVDHRLDVHQSFYCLMPQSDPEGRGVLTYQDLTLIVIAGNINVMLFLFIKP